jgi:hypothetical protein
VSLDSADVVRDVRVAAQVRAAHGAGVIHVSEGAFDSLAATAHQSAAPSAAYSSAIAIHRRLRLRLLRPVPLPAIWLCDVRPDAHGVEVHHRLIAVIPLVANDLFQFLRVLDVGLRFFDLLGRGNRGFDDRCRVALVGALHGDGDNRARLKIDSMLGFVSQMRAPVFHLRDLRIGIPGMRPVLVRRLLLALAVQPRQVLTRRRLDARGLREPRQKLLIGFRGVPAHDAPHRSVRFQRRRVDRDGLAFQQAGLDQPLLHPGKYGAMGFHVDQAPRPRNRRVVGRRLVKRQPNETADGQGIGGTPCDAALRVDAFEVSDEQQSEILAWHQARTPHDRSIEPATPILHEPIEVVCVQHGVQSRVEGMPRRRRQVGRGDPQRRLVGFSRAHGHARHCSTATTTATKTRQWLSTFTTGC